jgi:hypothetical protein
MNVRFFGGYKSEYVSIPKHNPIGLYFCADSRELFLGDKLLSDGLRVVATYADLPSISEHKAAEGVIYFVEDTKNGYVLPRGRSEWLQVIYSGTEVVLSNYYTKAEVDEAILDAIKNINVEVELDDYATKKDLAEVEAKIPTDYLKEIPAEYITETELTEATAGLATEEYVNTAISGIEIPKAYDDSEIRELLNAKAASEHTHDEYALTEHTHDEYLTEQSLEGYAKTSELFSKDYNELINKPTIPSIEGLATEKYVDDAVAGITIPKVPDVSDFITMKDVEAKGYITEVPAEYITESELDGKGYLTEQNLENYAKKDALFSKDYNELINKPELFSGNYHDLSNKPELFDGDYNSLTNTPEIPSVAGLATEQFVKDEIAKIDIPTVETDKFVTTEALAEALTEKADKVLFTTSKFVTNVIGSFTEGEDVKGFTIAELFAKLLGLNNEPEVPDTPTEPEGIVETILSKKEPIYQLMEDGSFMPTVHAVKEYSAENANTSKSESTTFYHIVQDGAIVESGYEHHTDAQLQMCYTIVLPDILDIREGGNVLVQTWDTTPPAQWTTAEYVLTDDLDEIETVLGIRPEVPAGYKLWADLSGADYGTSYRFIIKE